MGLDKTWDCSMYFFFLAEWSNGLQFLWVHEVFLAKVWTLPYFSSNFPSVSSFKPFGSEAQSSNGSHLCSNFLLRPKISKPESSNRCFIGVRTVLHSKPRGRGVQSSNEPQLNSNGFSKPKSRSLQGSNVLFLCSNARCVEALRDILKSSNDLLIQV